MISHYSKSEKYLERKLKEAIFFRGGICLKILCNNYTGFPDRMCLLPGGIVFFCEIKSYGFERSPRQAYVHKKLTQLGFKSYLIDNMEIINKLTGDDVSI